MRTRIYLKARIWLPLPIMNEWKNGVLPNNIEESVATAKQVEMIPVLAETVVVTKQLVETGHVRISKKVVSEERPVTVPVTQESYDIERVAVNQIVDVPPAATRQEGDVTIMSVLREVLVVQKRYEIVEEIRITKRKTETTNTQTVTLRKEEVTIDRRTPNP